MVRGAQFDLYLIDPRARVTNEAAFREMQDHIAKHYEGVDAEYSFEDAAGHVFDCIPVEQQPSLRGQTGRLPSPPDLRPVLEGSPPQPGVIGPEPPQGGAQRDRHGNLMQAPPGTIPMRRITLDELVRFRNLREFRQKIPGSGRSRPMSPSAVREKPASRKTLPSAPSTNAALNHRYAYTHQEVDNIGGHSSLALYAPAVDANQFFSLAQHWYGGGSGPQHQTAEVGWQVFPTHYGHAMPVLFIYWTADNYVSTGAYNLDAAGFVQTNGSWTIGGALSPVSVQGGQQMEIEAAYYLYNGNWWLYLGGLAPDNAIGYYPTSLYAGGQMATNASEILYGGETICRSVSWPPMGSGAFAAAGWQQAAYQRNIFYFPTGGGSQWANLTAEQPSLACYTLDLEAAATPWGVYFFFGGPGGSDC
jgi:hypothetical protein